MAVAARRLSRRSILIIVFTSIDYQMNLGMCRLECISVTFEISVEYIFFYLNSMLSFADTMNKYLVQ
jgi:hypothetical protein